MSKETMLFPLVKLLDRDFAKQWKKMNWAIDYNDFYHCFDLEFNRNYLDKDKYSSGAFNKLSNEEKVDAVERVIKRTLFSLCCAKEIIIDDIEYIITNDDHNPRIYVKYQYI